MFNSALARIGAVIQSRLVREERGATAVEYGLIVGLIAVAIIGAVVLMSGALQDMFGAIQGELEDAQTP